MKLDDLRVPPGNRLHALKDDRKGQRAVSINDQWRVCFRFVDGDAFDVEVCDYHYYGLSVAGLAEAAGVSRQSVNEILRGRRAISPEMALRLSRLFGNSPEFWMNAQRAVDLWEASRAIKADVARIQPLRVA